MFFLQLLGAGLLLTPALARPATLALSSMLSARDKSTNGHRNVGDYAYIGCWTELSAGWRTLGQKSTAYNSMTLESCMADCAGYPLFGTEYGRECYCGNYFFGGVSQVRHSQCDMPCAGNRSETCGAGMRLSVYQRSEKSSSPAVAAAAPAAASSPKSSTATKPITSSTSTINKSPTATSPSSTSHVSITSSNIAANPKTSTTPKAATSQTAHSSSSPETASASIPHTTSMSNVQMTSSTTSKAASPVKSTSTAEPKTSAKTSSAVVNNPSSSASSKNTPSSTKPTTTSSSVSTISLIHESAPSSNPAVSSSSSSQNPSSSVFTLTSVIASSLGFAPSSVIVSSSVVAPSSTISSSSILPPSSAVSSSSVMTSSLVLTSSSTSSSAAAASTAPHGKRGLAYNDPSYTSMFNGPNSSVSWGYDWAQASGAGFPSDYEFVPMLWSDAPALTSTWFASVEAAIASGTTHVLAFNEPDLTSQSNMSPAQAAESYMTWMQPLAGKVKLGAPAVSNGGSPEGLTWLGEFMGNCTECTIDFVPFHWYDAAWNYWYFKAYIEEFYQQIGLPLWITEFNGYGDDADVITFLELVMPWLDQLSYVQRYAWFGVFEGYLISSDGSSLSDYGVVYMNYTSTTLDPYFAS